MDADEIPKCIGSPLSQPVNPPNESLTAEKFIPFYLQGSREPFEDQDDIHFWRLGSSVATVCSVPWLVHHKVSLIIPQC